MDLMDDEVSKLNRSSGSSSSDDSAAFKSSTKHKKSGIENTDASLLDDWLDEEFQQILGMTDLEVSQISADSRELRNDLPLSKVNGLTVIDEVRDQKKVPLVVCLTTDKFIYVFRPSIECHVIFLNHMLCKPVIFFTRDGVWDAELLFRHTKIDLRKVKNLAGFGYPSLTDRYDLTSFDIHLILMKHLLEQQRPLTNYCITYVQDLIKPPALTFDELVEKWLGAKVKTECTKEELEAIRLNPKETTAVRAMRKQAGLVRFVGVKMWRCFDRLRDEPTMNIFKFAKLAPDDIMESYVRQDEQTYSGLISCLDQCPKETNNSRESNDSKEFEGSNKPGEPKESTVPKESDEPKKSGEPKESQESKEPKESEDSLMSDADSSESL